MTVGFWQIAIVALVVVLLFGRGKISELMGDVAKGIKSFKKGITEEAADTKDDDEKVIEHEAAGTATAANADKATSKRKAS